jgi:DNA-binding NarL/FixJ family response regulator
MRLSRTAGPAVPPASGQIWLSGRCAPGRAVATASPRSASWPGGAWTRVLVLTTHDTDSQVLPAIEAGATGYLLKDAPRAELLRAVRAAARRTLGTEKPR